MRAYVLMFLAVAGLAPGVAKAALDFEDKAAPPAAEAGGRSVLSTAPPAAPGLSIASFLGTSSLGLAPLRWGGNINDTFRWSQSDDRETNTNHFQSISLRAASYIWQPWLAQVNANLNFARGVADSSTAESETESQSVSGSGALNIFPQSRFPFSVTYSLSDSRTQARITQETTNERVSLRQDYRPVVGNARYTLTYDKSTMTSNQDEGEDTVDSWQGSYSNSFKNQTLSASAQYTQSDQGEGGESLALENYIAQHGWQVSDTMTLDNNASLTRSKFSGSDSETNRTRYLQAYSSASWTPNDKTSVSGGLRYFGLNNDTGGDATKVQSWGGNASINYRHSQNLSFNGGIALTHTIAEDGSTTISTQNGNVSYNHDPYEFGNFSYNWNANVGIANQWSREEAFDATYNASATHTLNHRYQINPNASLTTYGSQSLSVRYGDDFGASETLGHNAGSSLSISLSENLGASASLSASDTRTFGQERSDNQSVSLQANSTLAINAYSSASTNFNVQWNRNGTEDPESDGQATWSASGGASYMHSRAFGIPRLRYTFTMSVNYSHSNARLLGDADADRVRNGYTVDQHLDYQIGRIDARLTATQAMQDGVDNAMIYLQIGRSIGNY